MIHCTSCHNDYPWGHRHRYHGKSEHPCLRCFAVEGLPVLIAREYYDSTTFMFTDLDFGEDRLDRLPLDETLI